MISLTLNYLKIKHINKKIKKIKKKKKSKKREREREREPHLSDCVVELSGSDDHFHLKDVAFGHTLLNKTLQHLFLV